MTIPVSIIEMRDQQRPCCLAVLASIFDLPLGVAKGTKLQCPVCGEVFVVTDAEPNRATRWINERQLVKVCV